jgi:hypothetical protein
MQKSVSCVTRSVLKLGKNPYEVIEEPDMHILTFPDDPIPLRGAQNLALSVRHDYRIVRGEGLYRWRVKIEEFLWMLIEDFGVRLEQRNWKKILNRGRAQYERERTWRYIPTER